MTDYSDVVTLAIDRALSRNGIDHAELAEQVFDAIPTATARRKALSEIARSIKAAARHFANWSIASNHSIRIDNPLVAILLNGFPGAVSIKTEEGRRIKPTLGLAAAEFHSAGDVRRRNFESAQRAHHEWLRVELACQPYWDLHPDWSVARCLNQLAADYSKRGRSRSRPPEAQPGGTSL